MYLFHNDYNQMCHSAVLERFNKLSGEQMSGYGMDSHCENATSLIRDLCQNDNLSVHFMVGGTQTNLTVISSALRPHQAVLAAESGHVNIHETGAIEATGHKVVTVPSLDGKVTALQVRELAAAQVSDENAEHNVQIKMVYVSNPTELGTTYSHEELKALSDACKEFGWFLYLDGARLGYALTAEDNDLYLPDYAKYCDVFYIGGTKCGTMFGEAVVISNPVLSNDFRYMMKQKGGMLAKGWLIGLQFEIMFENGLYFTITKEANRHADRLRSKLISLGYPMLFEGNTNQVFPILPNKLLDKIENEFTFMIQERVDADHTAVRFCTSWGTKEESVDALCKALETC